LSLGEFKGGRCRCGVVVEGISDAILLPTLLRECAEGGEPLRYRILPGLSELGPLAWAYGSDNDG